MYWTVTLVSGGSLKARWMPAQTVAILGREQAAWASALP